MDTSDVFVGLAYSANPQEEIRTMDALSLRMLGKHLESKPDTGFAAVIRAAVTCEQARRWQSNEEGEA
jgi:hypothetical protein